MNEWTILELGTLNNLEQLAERPFFILQKFLHPSVRLSAHPTMQFIVCTMSCSSSIILVEHRGFFVYKFIIINFDRSESFQNNVADLWEFHEFWEEKM